MEGNFSFGGKGYLDELKAYLSSRLLTFDERRKDNPDAFNSRLGNKIQYILGSAPTLVGKNTIKNIQIRVDGRNIDLPKVEGIALINLPTYGGGNRFWMPCSKKERVYGFHNLHFNDGEIEVKGFSNLLTKLAKCCNPIYGDDVFGFISAEGVIKIHKNDCQMHHI